MAAVLLACGTKGKRHSLPHSRILIPQPSMSGLAGQATDIDIYAKEILRMRDTLNQILADATGQLAKLLRSDLGDYLPLNGTFTDGPHPLERANTRGKGLSLEVSTPGLTRPERRVANALFVTQQ